MNNIVKIRVFSMWETCERTTYFVELTTNEGFTMTPSSHRTGSVYTNHEGLSIVEARDRALIDAHEWGDFLLLAVDPYIEAGITYEPTMTLDAYTTRRELAARRERLVAA